MKEEGMRHGIFHYPLGLAALVVAAAGTVTVAGLRAQGEDPGLTEAVRLVQRGDFEGGALRLDTVVRKFETGGGRANEVARARVYLAIAYLGLEQEGKAKEQFAGALKARPDLTLTSTEFPPRVLQFFEQARLEAAPKQADRQQVPQAKPTAAPVTRGGTATPKKGGSKTLPILLGVGAAAGVGVAVAASGGGGPAPTPTPTPCPPVTTEGFSGSVTGADQCCHDNYDVVTVSCSGTLEADLLWTVTSNSSSPFKDPDVRLYLYTGTRDYSNGTGEDVVTKAQSVGAERSLRVSGAVSTGKYTLRVWSPNIFQFNAPYTLTVRHP